MSEWNITCLYGNKNRRDVLIVDPHGADAEYFLSKFPDFASNRQIKALGSAFEQFLAIEQDRGATELCHATAKALVKIDATLGVEIFQMNYPRAILDGGRLMSHLIRSWVPEPLRQAHHDDWYRIHKTTLARLDQRYQQLQQDGGLLLDLHTMAPYSPVDPDGQAKVMHATWENLEQYITDFVEAPQLASNRRHFDIITQDENEREIGCQVLSTHLGEQLDQRGIPWARNHPYRAVSHFMMNYHLTNARGVALDLPKDLLNSGASFNLATMRADPGRVAYLAEAIAMATWNSLQSLRATAVVKPQKP